MTLESKNNDMRGSINLLIETLEGVKGWGVKYIPAKLMQKALGGEAEGGKKTALEKLRGEELGKCTLCNLHSGRKNIVFGEGDTNAVLMFVGEAPGRDEDLQGRPFVGAAGQLLTKIIEAIGLKREEVYIANVLKCRPPNNRDPEEDEVKFCRPFLLRQIEIIQPKIICCLGRFATKVLLEIETGIMQARGKFYNFKGITVMPTYHPSYLLRNPSEKRPVWEDMKMIKKEYDRLMKKGDDRC